MKYWNFIFRHVSVWCLGLPTSQNLVASKKICPFELWLVGFTFINMYSACAFGKINQIEHVIFQRTIIWRTLNNCIYSCRSLCSMMIISFTSSSCMYILVFCCSYWRMDCVGHWSSWRSSRRCASRCFPRIWAGQKSAFEFGPSYRICQGLFYFP